MKYILLSFFVLVAFSCTKTKTNTITIDKHDTTTITTIQNDTTTIIHYNVSVIGNWKNAVNTISFNGFQCFLSPNPGYAYLADGDTIFIYHHDYSITPQYGYTISPTNDTLTLYPVLHSPAAPYIYYRY